VPPFSLPAPEGAWLTAPGALADSEEPPLTPVLYGGTQTCWEGGVGPASTLHGKNTDDPSTAITGSAHAMFDTATSWPSHVHVAGQSLSAVHTMVAAWQLDVDSVVVVHETPASSDASGGDAASAGMSGRLEATGGTATVVDAPLLPDPAPAPTAVPPPALPALAPPEQTETVSGTHVK